MLNTFTILTLNIERRKHLERIIPFLEEQKPDVICHQEIFDDTFQELKQRLQYHGVFSPRVEYVDEPGVDGTAILSRFPIKNYRIENYDQFTTPLAQFKNHLKGRPLGKLLTADIEIGSKLITVGNVHFTWSFGGEVIDEQLVNAEHLLTLLDQYKEIVLCGDFNTPRGKSIYTALKERYTDNIPAELETTIDPNLHRAGALQYVVDGLFTTPNYQASDVRIHKDISDHFGISATIQE
jgi:endonuclease/exonuclease/phosphatase family metal-dependent hydrolase